MTMRHRAVATLLNMLKSLRKGFPKASPNQQLPSLRPAFSLYDQINLIDNVPKDQLRFQGFPVFSIPFSFSRSFNIYKN
ncbi:hypothetical protein Pint_23365 [Pistacia integerrima]|uniref:Uncharacterized protein n=1 Tax=Pistacia integerrima TaxID=434235 RepID=A0ACC0YHI9_9ROSI|nr:hypothetical protein Pint_23365 [Pistacia integerrima]